MTLDLARTLEVLQILSFPCVTILVIKTCSADLEILSFEHYKTSKHKIVHCDLIQLVGWFFGLKGPLRQYFGLYRAVSPREREKEKRNDR